MILKLPLLFAATLLAFWISAICGGGASLILIPVLNLLLPTSLVPFSLTLGTFSTSASRLIVFKKHIVWKIVWRFVPFAIPAVLIGAWLIKFIDPFYLQLVVALLLLANLPQLFRSKEGLKKSEKAYPAYALPIIGFLAGLVSGITGAIGLLFNRFYLSYGLSKEEILATRAANEIILHLIKLIVYILLGLYSASAWYLGLLIATAGILSSYTIPYILPHLSEYLFKKIGYAAMVVSGFSLAIASGQHIIQKDQMQFTSNAEETTIKWRESVFVLEFAIDEGLEVERPIQPRELPASLQIAYYDLLPKYDRILLEKVLKLGEKDSYEFYCYKAGQLTKLEYEAED